MRRSPLVALAAVSGSVAQTLSAFAGEPVPTPEACIHTLSEARYGALGYNHIVHVANECAVSAECLVSTDVNPEPKKIEVLAHGRVDVVTFLGSPARVFSPRVACKMRGVAK